MSSITPPNEGPTCRHCGARRPDRSRGLCWVCYRDLRIREAHPRQDGPTQNRSLPTSAADPLPDEPTAYVPGSPGKVSVLQERARGRRQLFHPRDNQGEGGQDTPQINCVHEPKRRRRRRGQKQGRRR